MHEHRGNWARTAAGNRPTDSRFGKTLQAVDGVAYIMNRHAGGDAEFSGLFRDIEQKTGRTGSVGV